MAIEPHLMTDMGQLCSGSFDPADADVYDIGDDARKALAETKAWEDGLEDWGW